MKTKSLEHENKLSESLRAYQHELLAQLGVLNSIKQSNKLTNLKQKCKKMQIS